MKLNEIESPTFTEEEQNHSRIALQYIMSGKVLTINNQRFALANQTSGNFQIVLVAEDDTILGLDIALSYFIKESSKLDFDTAFLLSSELALNSIGK